MKKFIFIILSVCYFTVFSDTYTQGKYTDLVLNKTDKNTYAFILKTEWGATDFHGNFISPTGIKIRTEFGKAVKENDYYIYSGYHIFDENKICKIKFYPAKTTVNIVSEDCDDSEFSGFSGKFSNMRKSTKGELERLKSLTD